MFVAFLRRHWLRERALMSRHTSMASLLARTVMMFSVLNNRRHFCCGCVLTGDMQYIRRSPNAIAAQLKKLPFGVSTTVGTQLHLTIPASSEICYN